MNYHQLVTKFSKPKIHSKTLQHLILPIEYKADLDTLYTSLWYNYLISNLTLSKLKNL